MQKISEMIPGTNKSMEKVPWTWSIEFLNKYPNVFFLVEILPPGLGISPSTPQRGNPCYSPEGSSVLMVEGLQEPELLNRGLWKDQFRQGWGLLALLGMPSWWMEFLPFSFWEKLFFLFDLVKGCHIQRLFFFYCPVFKIIGRRSWKVYHLKLYVSIQKALFHCRILTCCV